MTYLPGSYPGHGTRSGFALVLPDLGSVVCTFDSSLALGVKIGNAPLIAIDLLWCAYVHVHSHRENT